MYRKEWECCNSVTETDSWEPEECPFCSPFRTKDLSDDEIAKFWAVDGFYQTPTDFARAVIAADRSKNK